MSQPTPACCTSLSSPCVVFSVWPPGRSVLTLTFLVLMDQCPVSYQRNNLPTFKQGYLLCKILWSRGGGGRGNGRLGKKKDLGIKGERKITYQTGKKGLKNSSFSSRPPHIRQGKIISQLGLWSFIIYTVHELSYVFI